MPSEIQFSDCVKIVPSLQEMMECGMLGSLHDWKCSSQDVNAEDAKGRCREKTPRWKEIKRKLTH